MAGELGFGWFVDYTLDGVGHPAGDNGRVRNTITTAGALHEPGHYLKVKAGQSAVLWQYETTNQSDTSALREFEGGLVEVDGSDPEGGVYVSFLVGKKTTGNLPLDLATDADWQGHLWLSCHTPHTLPSMRGLYTSGDSRAQSGSLPAIYTDVNKEEARVYRVAVHNPGTEDVTVRLFLWG